MARVLRAKVYDAIQAGAAEYGGIGWGPDFENDRPPLLHVDIRLRGKPLSAFALAVVTMGGKMDPGDEVKTFVRKAFNEAEMYRTDDNLLEPLAVETAGSIWPRVSFESWCRVFDVVRKVYKPSTKGGTVGKE